ncbi:MAG: DUF4249 domain-containing protein [Bacteroidales bacterium]|nr:DUF4249 domain-containing protein [Bacteroidales bacterium]
MRVIIFLSLILLFLSCTKQIEITQKFHDPKYVVNCLFSNDNIFEINLTKSIQINDTNTYVVKNAEIELFENGVFVENLFWNDSSKKYNSTIFPTSNKIYTIVVTTDDNIVLTATDTLPSRVEITELSYNQFAYINDEADLMSENTLYFNTNLQAINFYQIMMFFDIENFPFNWENLKSRDSIILKEQTFTYSTKYLIFSDKIFYQNPSSISFSFKYSDFSPLNYIIQFKRISYSYFMFKKMLRLHIDNQNSDIWDGVSDPVQMYSNIENGYGIFAGYTIDTIHLNL